MKNLPTLLIVLAFIFMISCKGDQSTQAEDNILDIALSKEPTMLNPIVNPGATERIIFHNIFTTLADFHPETYELSPILIKAIPDPEEITDGPYKGGTKYTINIKDVAKWDNGSPITGKDVLFTMKTILHPGTNTGQYESLMRQVDDVRVNPKDDREVTFFFKDYYILAKELVVTVEVYPQYHYDPDNAMDAISYQDLIGADAKQKVEADPKLVAFADSFNSVKYARESINGAGPYRLKEWISNQLIVLEKKENYWADGLDIPSLIGNPDEIKYHIIADETATITQLKEGNIDLFTNMTASSFFDLRNNETFKDQFSFMTPELLKFYYIDLNNEKPELSDPDVRRALAKLIDVKQLVEILEGGLGTQTVGYINEKKSYHNDDLKPIMLDIEGAKKILTDEGWSDSNNDGSIDKILDGRSTEMDLDIFITGSPLSKNIALLLQENAKQVGVKINIITKKYKDAMRENVKKGDYHMIPRVLGQDLVIDDPYARWHSDNIDPSKNNDTGYRSDAADDLIEKIRATKNDEERAKYYKQIQAVMYEDQPVIFLYNPQEKIILSKKWKGNSTLKRPGYFAGTFELAAS